jgi:hypothetical protein
MKLISDELIAALLRYLAQRPYQEVAQAIQALSQLQEAPSAPVTRIVPDLHAEDRV